MEREKITDLIDRV